MNAITLPSQEIRRITTAEYHQMASVGILAADEQVELIAGQIIQKMPKGPAHSALCKRLEKLLEQRLGEQALVQLQDPIQLNPYSEPEPDIAVVCPSPNFYADRHPTPEDTYLVIEVADTTIQRDLSIKADLYAEAGIADYWVANVTTQELHIFREPQADGYQRQLIVRKQQSVNLLTFPNCVVTVEECFGRNADFSH